MKINEIYYKKINEKLYVGEHESGLKVYVFPKKDFNRKHAYFMTEYGSVFNSFVGGNGEIIKKPIGIAHFLEHKIFEEDEGNIFEKFALLGADVNAYTKFESTTYNFMDVSQAKFIFGFKDIRKYSSIELFKRSLAIKMAIVSVFGVSSSFYNTAYEEGMIDESFSTEHSFSKYYLHTIFGGESDYPNELYKKVLNEINYIKKEGFDIESLIRIKRKFTGRYIASFNSLQSIASVFTDYYIKGINSFDYLDVLETISPDYIKEVFDDHFDTNNAIISIIESEGDKYGGSNSI